MVSANLRAQVEAIATEKVANADLSCSGAITQGVTGSVFEKLAQPMKVGKTTMDKTPLETLVVVFEPTTAKQLVAKESFYFEEPTTPQVTQVATSQTGCFAISLPAGQYSVFIKNGEKGWRTQIDAQGNCALISIQEGQLLLFDLLLGGVMAQD
jgi:hypothetical protein